ncbi:MAG: GCN5-related N-acetyltransferase [Ramlibacter sp.]|nr:GCN5-related N-acetyltransferase [Ramlibacter sp.]
MTTPAQETKFADNAAQSRFELRLGGRVAAFADYEVDGDSVRIVHTEVAPENEGSGLGSRLAKAALDEIRERGKRVVPVCPFIASYIERHPEYADLVAER